MKNGLYSFIIPHVILIHLYLCLKLALHNIKIKGKIHCNNLKFYLINLFMVGTGD